MPKSSDRPTVYVIAGLNGAGKTTFATKYLPRTADLPEFLNADLIASGIAPFAPESQSIRAGKILLERFQELSAARKSFCIETTLSGRTYPIQFRKLRDAGYHVLLYFLWLPSVDTAVERVAGRVRLGGHHVPERDIRRRYERGRACFLTEMRDIADSWWLYDAAELPPKLIASSVEGNIEIASSRAVSPVRVEVGDHPMIRKSLTAEQAGIEAEIAFQEAAWDVIKRHRDANVPIVVWDHEAGKVKHVDPKEMEAAMQAKAGRHEG
jgi:predicted ABC-type ATPase